MRLNKQSFYDPIKDRLIEPLRTGISYSFSADGYYEEAYYRALDNRELSLLPLCVSPALTWNAFSYKSAMHTRHAPVAAWKLSAPRERLYAPDSDRSRRPSAHIQSMPIEFLDLHALQSNRALRGESFVSRRSAQHRAPCTDVISYQRYEAYIDPYHNHMRLNLFRFNGAPLPPMYLVYNSPQMLPTTTLHPLPTSSTMTIPGATGAGDAKAQRRDSKIVLRAAAGGSNVTSQKQACRLFWAGITLTGIGSVLILSSLVHSLVKLM